MTVCDRDNQDGGQHCVDDLATNGQQGIDLGRSHRFDPSGCQDWWNGIAREESDLRVCQCLKQEIDSSVQPEIIQPGACVGLKPSSSKEDATNTTNTHSSLDEDVQTQPSIIRTTERSDCSEALVRDTACVRELVNTVDVVEIDDVGFATRVQTRTTVHRSAQAQLSQRIHHPLSERGALKPESIPLEIPTGGPVPIACTAEQSKAFRNHEMPVATTCLVPAVSQSAKTALTTHSSATEPHGNLSRDTVGGGGASLAVPRQVDSRARIDEVPPTPPPDDVVATWERALAATLASSSYSSTSPMETLSSGWSSAHAINASSVQLPPSRISGLMCRSNDAVLIDSFSVDPRGNNPRVSSGVGRPHRHVKAWFVLPANSGVEDHKPPMSQLRSPDKDQRKKCGRFALFAIIVSVVTGVTIVGAVFASRAPSAPTIGLTPSGSCISRDATTPALEMLLQKFEEANSTETIVLQEWRSSWNRGSAFGELVALSEDGGVMAITERVRGGSSAVYIVPAGLTNQAVDSTSVVSIETSVTSLSLSRDGSVLAVGLSNGVAQVYSQDALCTSQWNRMGDSIRQHGAASLRQLSTQANYTTSVSISGDGMVVAVGIVTASNAAHYQVVRFSKGRWQPKGPAIEYGDDGSFVHTSATVSLSSNCTGAPKAPCILAISRMFSYEQFSFGVISVRKIRSDEQSWDTLGQAIPFAIEEAKVELASNGSRLSVSDVASTTVYSLGNDEKRVEWVQLGQNDLPKSSGVALDESGERLTLSENNTIVVYDLQPAGSASNGSAAAQVWSELHRLPIDSESDLDAAGSRLRLAIGHQGDRVVVGEPYFSIAGDQSIGPQGRVLLVGF